MVKVSKLRESAILPTRGSEQAAGYDLYLDSLEEINVYDYDYPLQLPTGIAFEIPEGWAGFVKDRSSLARWGVYTGGGVIDSDYRGEVFVVMTRVIPPQSGINIVLKPGDRIAQIVFTPVYQLDLIEVDDLTQTIRGAGGFGSTGL